MSQWSQIGVLRWTVLDFLTPGIVIDGISSGFVVAVPLQF